MADETTIIYQVPGKHRLPKGKTYSYRGLEHGEKMPDGWHKTLKAAIKAAKD